MNEIYRIKEINFDFRNKYKYADETNGLKRALIFLTPYIEDYLKDKEIITKALELINSAGFYIHFAITDPETEGSFTKCGSVSLDNKRKQLIIILRLINAAPIVIKFELMRTMIHEIFHLFIEGEENVRRSVEEFLNSFDFEEKKILLGKILTPEEEKKIIEESLR